MPRKCPVCGGKYSCPAHYVFPSVVKAREAVKNGTIEVKPRTPIAKVSKDQAKINRAYAKVNKIFKEAHDGVCEGKFHGCTYRATDTHHSEGRGKKTLDVSKFKRLCRNCHDIVGANNNLAFERGLSGSRLSNQSI